jgi:hypothetical protein
MKETRKPEPRFSELLLTLQHEIQQAIEYLSLAECRKTDQEHAPSSGFVIANKIALRLPLILELRGFEIPGDLLQGYRIPVKPFLRALHRIEKAERPKERKTKEMEAALTLNVRLPSETEPPTLAVGELNIEFLVAGK